MKPTFVFCTGLIAPPPKATRGMVSGSMQPENVVKAYHASATKLGSVLLVALAVVVSVGAKGLGFVIQNLPNLPIF